MLIPFQPTDGTTVSISATTTSARVKIGGEASLVGARIQVRVVNSGTTTAFIKFGDSTVVATASDIPVLGGQTFIFTVNETSATGQYAAAIMGTGTATVYLTTGVGIS